MSRKVKRGLLAFSILLVAVLATAGLSKMKPPPEKKTSAKLDVLVNALPLTAGPVQFTVNSQGTVQPRTETVLVAEVAGPIINLSPKFVAGGVFAANEELLRIDPAIFAVTVEQARAVLAQRQIEYDGARSLKDRGYRAETELAGAAAALATARADVARAERDLQRTSVRLPYAGMVRAREANLGQYVTPGSRLGVTFATDYAEVRLPLTDSDMAFVDLPKASSIGSAAGNEGPRVMLSAVIRGKRAEWDARITRTEGVIDEKTRVTYAVARINDPYQFAAGRDAAVPLPMGAFVSAQVRGISRDNVITVPRSAVRGGNQLLFIDEDSRLDIRRVEILRSDARFAYITGGASPGERITPTTIEAPVNGMKVRVSGEQPPGESQPSDASEAPANTDQLATSAD